MNGLQTWLNQEQPRLSAYLKEQLGLSSELVLELLAAFAAEDGATVGLNLNLSEMEAFKLLWSATADLKALLQAENDSAIALDLSAALDKRFAAVYGAWLTDPKPSLADMDRLQADKHKMDFISVASHELKTPLTLLEAYVSMLEGREDIAKTVGGLGKGLRRLREIIDDMIDVAALDMGLMSFARQELWLTNLLPILTDNLRGMAETRRLSISLDPENIPTKPIQADPERLYQALVKIGENAIKYTPDGGQIIISARNNPRHIEICIQDSGIGINAEDHAIIFEKFFALGAAGLHSSSKSKFKGGGPGLGLAIARGIIEGHGGQIRVESGGYDEVALHGSRFCVWLPLE